MLRQHFFVLIFVVFAVKIAWSDESCERAGAQCSPDGGQVWLCVKKGEPPIDITECRDNQRCRETKDQVACTDQSSEFRFKCTANGEFPDPLNCSRTYICSVENDKPQEVCHCLGGNYIYPMQGLYCVPGACPREEIVCSQRPFGYFTLTGGIRSSYYYFCNGSDVMVYEVGERRSLSTIKNGKKCEPFNDTKPTEPTSEPTKPTEPTSEPTPSSTTLKPEQKPECSNPGEFHNSECDCDFYECDKNLVPKRRTCREGMLFSEKLKKCIYGDCDPSKCVYREKEGF